MTTLFVVLDHLARNLVHFLYGGMANSLADDLFCEGKPVARSSKRAVYRASSEAASHSRERLMLGSRHLPGESETSTSSIVPRTSSFPYSRRISVEASMRSRAVSAHVKFRLSILSFSAANSLLMLSTLSVSAAS